MRSSRLHRGTGGSDEKNVVLSEERKTERDSPVRLPGPGKDCVLMLTQIMFTRLVKRSRDVTTGLWELSVSGKSNLHCRYEGERETSWDLNTKIRLRIQYYLCQLPPPPSLPPDSWMWYNDGSVASVWIFNMVISFNSRLCIANNNEESEMFKLPIWQDRWLSNTGKDSK